MGMLTGYMLRYTGVKTVGLCHSVQGCSRGILRDLGIEVQGAYKERIAGVNHMGWLLEIYDADGKGPLSKSEKGLSRFLKAATRSITTL